MATNDLTLAFPRNRWEALAGLFDEAWRRGRKRQSRYVMILLLSGATAGGAFVVGIGRAGPAADGGTRTTVDRYTVCAANVEDIWRYTYGAGCAAATTSSHLPYTYAALVLPAGSKVELVIAPTRTAHALRIKGLGLTLRAGTRSTVQTTLRTPRAGETFFGECLEACGRDPGLASTNVTVVRPERYKRWVADHAKAIAHQNAQAGRLRTQLIQQHVFASNAPR